MNTQKRRPAPQIARHGIVPAITKRRPAVDPNVYDLAEHFLDEIPSATEDDFWDLAGTIQTACEDACRELEARQPKPKETP
jgi:hypothetical protein